MAYISHNNLWQSEFDNIVSKRYVLQDLNINQLKLEVHDTYEKDEKISTNFKPTDDSDFINKAYLDKKLSKTEGHIPYKEEKKKMILKSSARNSLLKRFWFKELWKQLYKYFKTSVHLVIIILQIEY